MTNRIAKAWVGAALLLVVSGCGIGDDRPRAYPATGEVFYRGAPLADAQVTFIPKENQGKVSRGTTGAEGRFELGVYTQNDGALAGDHQVTVVKVAAVPGKGDSTYAVMKSVIPEKYMNSGTSPLRATVTANEKNHFRFELVD